MRPTAVVGEKLAIHAELPVDLRDVNEEEVVAAA